VIPEEHQAAPIGRLPAQIQDPGTESSEPPKDFGTLAPLYPDPWREDGNHQKGTVDAHFYKCYARDRKKHEGKPSGPLAKPGVSAEKENKK